jgi:type II secretory pathway pseudopilin PulG
MRLPAPPARRSARAGFSLLEVLVACGVLVIGLAGIAAIMPAAGARLGEASAQDRANSAVANAFAEIKARGLCSKSLFEIGGGYSGTAAAVFGAPLGPLQNLAGGLPTGLVSGNAVGSRIAQDRGFYLEDELVYSPSADDVPQNSFVDGVREFNRGVCWGATVAPVPWPTSPSNMKVVEVSVAVFRKPPTDAVDIQLQQASGNVFTVSSPTGFDDGARRTFLKPCGFVLAVPASPGAVRPQWIEVNSSWMKGSSAQVSFRSDAYESIMASGSIRVIGFENLITVSKQVVKVPL